MTGSHTHDTHIFEPLVKKLAELYRYQLRENDINASGKLSNINLEDKTIDIDWDDKSFRVYFILEDYWKWVEYGRRPGTPPPIEPIENWIKVKKIVPKAKNGEVPTTKQLALYISKKIGKYGTKPKSPLKNALNSPEATNIVSEIKNLLIKQINNEIRNEIKSIIK